jgi:hypothetical protein
MNNPYFSFTVYRLASRVGITFQPTPSLSYKELREMIHWLELVAERMDKHG